MVSRQLWTLVLAVTLGVLLLTPTGAAAGTPRYDQARRITVRIAHNAANLYGGDHARFTGCTRTSPRRLACSYEFRVGSPDLDLTWCFGDVLLQAGKRGIRFRAPLPDCG